MNRTMYLLVILGLFSSLRGQTHDSKARLWRHATELEKSQLEDSHLPLRDYVLTHFDLSALKQILASAPVEHSVPIHASNAIISLPNPSGQPQSFHLWEYQMMEPGLKAKYPHFRTLIGRGQHALSVRLRLDFTATGLRAMVIEGNRIWYLEPLRTDSGDYYQSFYLDAITEVPPWNCLVDAPPRGHESQSSTRVGDCQLRTFRTAISTTGEYTQYHGGTVANGVSAVVTAVNRLNELFELEIAVRLTLVANNDQLINTNPATDPFDNSSLPQMIVQNQTTVDAIIGSTNYDLGHVFGTAGGGLAGLGAACNNAFKARGGSGIFVPAGDFYIYQYVGHEMGHQFGANHTQNNDCNRAPEAAYEVGSGSTIMGYAGVCNPNVQFAADHFYHAHSLEEMAEHFASVSCPTLTPLNNEAPQVDAGSDYIIPHSTPFALNAKGSDPDGDALTYSWEQWDRTLAPMPPLASSPAGPTFRTYIPKDSSGRTFPDISHIVTNFNYSWEVLPSVSRTLDFRVTVRDNHPAGGCTSEDSMQVHITDQAGPFVVTNPNTSFNYEVGQIINVTWNVANTDLPPIRCEYVDIYLSANGGFSYPFVLAQQEFNDGSAQVQIPNLPGTQNRIRVQARGNVFFDISNQDFTISPAQSPQILMSLSNNLVQNCAPDTQWISLELEGATGATGPVDLSTNGLPTGMQAIFSQNPTNLPATVDLMLISDNVNSPSAGTFDITASNAAGTTTVRIVNFRVDAGQLDPPNQTSPPDLAAEWFRQPIFSWTSGISGVSFDLEVATSPRFEETTVIRDTMINNTGHQVSRELAPGTVYYWRVRSRTECRKSSFSPTFRFQTDYMACHTYEPSFLPVFISSGSTTELNSIVQVSEDRPVRDIKIRALDIEHDNVGDLTIGLKRGNEIKTLLRQPCQGDSLMIIDLDEAGRLQVPCPVIDGGTYQAEEDLDQFYDQSGSGTWALNVKDDFVAGGGFIHNWRLELCYDSVGSISDPNLLNLPMGLPNGDTVTITNLSLEVQNSAASADEILYTLFSLPTEGTLLLNGFPLAFGDQFTQEDILQAALQYAHNGGNAISDQFDFSVAVLNGGWRPDEVFVLDIWTTAIDNPADELAKLQLLPNPAQDQFEIQVEAPAGLDYSLEIHDLMGRGLIWQQTWDQNQPIESQTIQSSDWASGIYLVSLRGKGIYLSQKILIQ